MPSLGPYAQNAAPDLDAGLGPGWQAMLDTLPLATFLYDQETLRYLAVNEAAIASYGYSRAEFLQMTIAETCPQDSVPRLLELFQRARSKEERLGLWRHRRKDGSLLEVEVVTREAQRGEERVRLMVAHDVTAAQREHRALTAVYRIAEAAGSEGTLVLLLAKVHSILAELMPVPNIYVALLDESGERLVFPYFVDEMEPPPQGPEPLGRGLTEYVLRTGEPLLITGREQLAVLMLGEAAQVGPESLSWLGVPLKMGGRVAGVLATQVYSGTFRYREPEKELLQFVCSQAARAIERKQAEETLRAREEHFRALSENSSDGVLLHAPGGLILWVSRSVARLLGYPPEALLRRLARDYIHPEDLGQVREAYQRITRAPSERAVLAYRVRHADGSWRWLEVTTSNLLADPAVGGFVVNFRDVTERKQMEARLLVADRMASVGTLAAGVAHEINNPLAYVIANLEFMAHGLGRPEQEADVREALEEARNGAERVRHIVRDLKTFSRVDDRAQGPIEVSRVLDTSANIAWNEIRQRARLVKDYAQSLPAIIGNESRLGQVFVNLLLNAAQAIPPGRSEENEIRITTRATDRAVEIEIRDTGSGIPRENLHRIFDPFFTSKPVGVGTGLGLFVCQNLVTAMGGEISVESAVAVGSNFKVRLPLPAL